MAAQRTTAPAYSVLKLRNARRRQPDQWSVSWAPCSEWQRRPARDADRGRSG